MHKATILLNMAKLGKVLQLPLLGKAGEGRGSSSPSPGKWKLCRKRGVKRKPSRSLNLWSSWQFVCLLFLNVLLVLAAATEKCGPPPSVANGALTLPALPQYDSVALCGSGSSVQYICSDYHFLQGPEGIYCSEGQWALPPVCIGRCDE